MTTKQTVNAPVNSTALLATAAADATTKANAAQAAAIAAAAAAYAPVTQATTNATVTRIGRYAIADGAVLSLRFIVTVRSTDGSGAVLAEWNINAAYRRVGGTLVQAYAPVITNTFSVGAATGGPTLSLNGNTDVDLNVTGIAATNLTWMASIFSMTG